MKRASTETGLLDVNVLLALAWAQPVKAPCLSVFSEIVGRQQVTDAYRTRVAAAHEVVFITFERRLENYRGAQVRVLS